MPNVNKHIFLINDMKLKGTRKNRPYTITRACLSLLFMFILRGMSTTIGIRQWSSRLLFR